MAGTALASGVLVGLAAMVAMPRPAMANCDESLPGISNIWDCHGSPVTSQQNITPDGTFVVIGFGTGDTPFQQTYTATTNPAFIINAGTEDGTVTMRSGSFIHHTTTEGGIGLEILDGGTIGVTIQDEAEITGTTGIYVNGNGTTDITITNNGHVEGTAGAGIEITEVDVATINNHSYLSVLGDNGDHIFNVKQAIVDNTFGLTAGISNDGLLIDTISGDLLGPVNAVDVDNTHGGVFAGGNDGIGIFNVNGNTGEGDAADIHINNSAAVATVDIWGYPATWTPGGLIVGQNEDGIVVVNANGNLWIENNFTREGAINLNTLDDAVDPLLTGLQNGFTNGIWGGEDGVHGYNIAGDVNIDNVDGQIVGADKVGIELNHVGGTVNINNGDDMPSFGPFSLASESESFVPMNVGGTIWGGEDGINISESGDVWINNHRGSIFGGDPGISMFEVGDVGIWNAGGLIEGYAGDGINILAADKVGIFNGGGALWDPIGGYWTDYQEGHIISAGIAINLDVMEAFILNFDDGAIIGDGMSKGPSSVIKLRTNNSNEGGSEAGDAGALVINSGIMASMRIPTFDIDPTLVGTPDPNVVPPHSLDMQQITEDVADIAGFAWSGGASSGPFGTGIDTLHSYAETASDLLLQSEGGAAEVINLGGGFGMLAAGQNGATGGVYDDGLMFGRVNMIGATDKFGLDTEAGTYTVPEGTAGNVVMNFGKWLTTNQFDFVAEDGSIPAHYVQNEDPSAGNILTGDGHDVIFNGGLIQTAFGDGIVPVVVGPEGAPGPTYFTSFVVDDFYNGGFPDSVDKVGALASESEVGDDGLLSMISGVAGDETYIFGDFHGQTEEGYRSYLGVDVDFSTAVQLSDTLEIGTLGVGPHEVFGSTGVIAHKLNDVTDNVVGTIIPLAFADIVDLGVQCGADWCMDGDAFFVSEISPDYVNVGGTGFVRDGWLMWGIQEQPGFVPADVSESESAEYDWVSRVGTDGPDQPVLITAAQGAWYDSAGVVEDHVYGNTYPGGGAGGAGADLSYEAPPAEAPQASGHQSAIWGKATGSWTNRDTEVTTGAPPVTFDTSMNQNSYSLIGGLELRPKGGDSDTRLGLFGGYIGSNVSFVSYGGAANYSGGTVGGYAAWIQGPMYIDGEVKADFLSVHYTSPSVDFTTGVTSVGVLANAGYRMENGNAFLEPIASFAYVNTGLGNLSGPPTITYSNGQSIRAGIGARVGATMGNPGETQTEIDLLGKVWNEFGGPNTVTFDDGVNPPESFTDGISGIFGEVVGRATIYNADRSASGFVSVGGRFGSNFTTIQAKAGVRKTF